MEDHALSSKLDDTQATERTLDKQLKDMPLIGFDQQQQQFNNNKGLINTRMTTTFNDAQDDESHDSKKDSLLPGDRPQFE